MKLVWLIFVVGVFYSGQISISQAQILVLHRLATGLDRPSHAVQAPGDSDGLYVIEQRAGRIVRIDLASSSTSVVAAFSGFDETIEGGVHTMAFHPQFEQNRRFYVAWLEDGGEGVGDFGNVDEFSLQADGTGQFHNRIFRYQLRDSSATHGLNWIGFDPTAAGDAESYLFITTGDGGFDGANLAVDYAQDLTTPFGKVFRVDLRSDNFPGDPDRNFAIPADNPYANHSDPAVLPEVFHSGLRNPWRASFDVATGDFYLGDVGQGNREEIDFVKAGESGVDFGWNAFEGTSDRGKASLHPAPRLPIHEYDHSGGNVSVTGGFVYRGPIESLQGEYFFGDFNTSRVWSGRFDRDTAAFEFDGGNFYDLVERSFAVADDLRAGSPIDHLVSFGKDLDDNLLVVDYGEGNLFNPTPNTGEIFRLDAVLYPDINQDGVFNVGDWNAFKSNVGQDTSGMSDVNAYLAGDLDLDGSVGLRDAHEFAAIYDAQFGIDAFARDVAVPEPSSSAMLLAAMSLLTSRIIVSYRAFNAFPGIAPTSFTRRDAIQNTFVAIPTIRRNRRC